MDLRDDFRVELSSRREEYVEADIRAFFHSIYTHAIAWSIYGKAWAKQNRGLDHYGNLIDLLCRNAQDGQTIGLPVGPDTSRLIAEVVASAIDATVTTRLNVSQHDASRYIDDYTISSPEASGEELLAALRQSAAAFELELNNEKSAIHPTSHRQNAGWQEAVRAHIPRPPVDAAKMQHFFYQLGRLCLEHPETNVEKFALQNARSVLVNSPNWRATQFNLISAYRRNSSLVSILVEVCLLRHRTYTDVLLDDLREFIENRAPVLARTDRTGEMVWLLFLAIRLNLTLSAARLSPLFQLDNALVALLVSCLEARTLVQGKVDRTLWNRSLNGAGLRSSMWLYAYEATTQGFLTGVSDSFISQDPYFSLLQRRRVQFLSVERGYTSIGNTLRNLRIENERTQRMRAAIQSVTGQGLDDLEEHDEDQDEDEIEALADLY